MHHTPDSVDQARGPVRRFVRQYNHYRLHSAIGFVTPADMLAGRAEEIWAARDRKLEAARARRREQAARTPTTAVECIVGSPTESHCR
jgi:putative transposase